MAEEKEINSRLLQELRAVDNEKHLLEKIIEQHEIQNQLQEKTISRISRRAAELQKKVVKEKTAKEVLIEQTSYSNPAKLMNYFKAKKSRENGTFKDLNEYVSHVDAYAKTSNKISKEELDEKRATYAKLIANKRSIERGDVDETDEIRSPSFCVDDQHGDKHSRLCCEEVPVRDVKDEKHHKCKKQFYPQSHVSNRLALDPPDKKTLQEMLADQRKALRNFSSYCA